MHTAKLAASLLVLLALTLAAAPVHAETTNCTAITALPAVITLQGIYCFTGHLNTSISSGNAIEIPTNNVVLDLNGFKLGGLAAGPGTQANGIFATDRQNITIKNETIRGFFEAIFLQDSGASQGHVVEAIRADQNTLVGIEVQGSGNTFGQGSGFGLGIDLSEVTGGLAINNRITTADRGIDYGGSTGKYRDNVTFDVTAPYTGGTDIGNNN